MGCRPGRYSSSSCPIALTNSGDEMTKLSGWILAIYVLVITGIAAYEYAVIDRLQWIIRMLLAGSSQ